MLWRRGFGFSRGRGLRRERCRTSLSLTDQGHQVGLKPWSVLCGVAQQDLDQAAFTCAEVSLNASTREAVQECDRLLSQKLFEFLSRHVDPVNRET